MKSTRLYSASCPHWPKSTRYAAAVLLFVSFCLAYLSASNTSVRAQGDPRVSGIAVRKLTASADKTKVTLAIEISGDNFGPTATSIVVKLVNLESGSAIDVSVSSHDGNLITGIVELPLAKKPVKYQFRITVGGKSALQSPHIGDYTLEVGKEEKQPVTPTPFEITFEQFKSKEYPNLHSLVITNKNDNSKPGFSANPALMKVDIVPPGATNVSIQSGSSPYQMFVTFLASEDFEVKSVAVTVFDPESTLTSNQPLAFSTPFREKQPKANPNQPTINDIQVLSMQRHSGYGTVRLSGSGFGDYERSPITGERELLCCLNRPSNPDISDEQQDRRGRPTTNSDLKQVDAEVCPTDLSIRIEKCSKIAEWRHRIEERVNVTLMPRNADLRIERTQIMYIDDKVIDVYFEFTHYDDYSIPLRLENATVTVNKGAVKEARTADDTGTYTAVLASPQTFLATKDVGSPRDKNLEYRYVVLNETDASHLFGSGVGDNFYVVELTVVNNNKKKMAIPLGTIQAEAAWKYGYSDSDKFFFDQGPATLPSLPLAAVAGYFDAYQKSKGRRAKVFNVLEGVAMMATGLVPVFGHNIERPASILSGSFIPALRRSLGDLSSEQLQRLTALSWENVEEIVPGGSITKFIYIPRAEQFFGNTTSKDYKAKGPNYKIRKQIINLIGMEVSGFEITESEKKQATEANKEGGSALP